MRYVGTPTCCLRCPLASARGPHEAPRRPESPRSMRDVSARRARAAAINPPTSVFVFFF